MMGGLGGWGGYGGSMMSGFGGWGLVLWLIVFIDLVLVGIWLWQQINKNK